MLFLLAGVTAPPVAQPQSIERSCCTEIDVSFAEDRELFPNVTKVDAGWGPGSKTLLDSARGLYRAEPMAAPHTGNSGDLAVLLLYTHSTPTSKWRMYRQETPTTHKAVRRYFPLALRASRLRARGLGHGLFAAASPRRVARPADYGATRRASATPLRCGC